MLNVFAQGHPNVVCSHLPISKLKMEYCRKELLLS